MTKSLSDYHRSLKQYLNVSSERLTPETSTRVTKAREKLLKLTSSQFFDLATDVYDELQRRLDERSDPTGFLTPIDNFHPKRNQARQKLATLPSTRFKDLVNDVLFEIERREPVQSPITDQSQSHYYSNSGIKTPLNDHFEETNMIEKATETPSQREIKTSTVVPKKSQLSWSSDEEEAEDDADDNYPRPHEGASSIISKSKDKGNHSSPQKSIRSNHSGGGLRQNDMNSYGTRSPIHERNMSIQSRISNKENDTKTLLEEGAKMDQEITRLQKQLIEKEKAKENLDFEIDSLTKENELLNRELLSSKQGLAELEELKTKNETLTKQLEEKTFEHEDLQRSLDNHLTESNLNNSKYESLLSDYNGLNEEHEKAIGSHSETRQGFIQKIEELNNEIKSLRDQRSEASTRKSLSSEEQAKIEDYDILNNKYQLLQKDHDNLVVSHSDVSKELNFVKSRAPQEKARDITPTEGSISDSKSITSLRAQLKDWQSKYEELRSNQVADKLETSFTKKDLNTFVSSSGAIPMSLVAKFNASTEIFVSYLSSDDADVRLLFERASSMVSTADKISGLAKYDSNPSILEKSSSIKAQNSNLLSSLRKYSIYKNFSPKSLIYKSIEELHFTVCEFISLVKIKDGDYTAVDSLSERSLNVSQSEKSTVVAQPTTPDRSSERKLSVDTTSPMVRPLRMAQKLNSPVENMSSSNGDVKPKSFGNAMKGISPIRSLSPIQVTSQQRESNNSPKKTPIQQQQQHQQQQQQQQQQSSPRNTPSPSNSIAEKMKRLQQNSEAELGSSKEKATSPIKIASNSSSAFDKFGARRRNSSVGSKDSVTSPVKQLNFGAPMEAKKTSSPAISNPMLDDDDNEEKQAPASTRGTNSRVLANDKIGAPPSSSGSTIPSAGSALNYTNEDDQEAFDFENFNTLNPDNTLQELLSYLEHQTHEVINAIQILLESIRDPKATKNLLRGGANEIIKVVNQMAEGTTTLMTQARYQDSIGHAKYVVATLEDCVGRMEALYNAQPREKDHEYAEKSFKQRSAGLAFDVAKSTKELVKTVEEASLKDEIAVYDDRLKK